MSGTRRIGPLPSSHTPAEAAVRVNALLKGPFSEAVAIEATLVEGLNRIGHGMGSTVSHFVHAALPTTGVTIANAQAENPRPERQVWVRMAGATEVRALLFLLPTQG